MLVIILAKEASVKVTFNLNREHAGLGSDKVSFNGYKPLRNEHGFKEYEFSYPFDEDSQNCYLEVFSVETDSYGNFKSNSMLHAADGKERIKLNTGSNVINLAKTFGIDDQTPFAYHYIVESKYNTSDFKPQIDAGTSIDERPQDHDSVDSRIYNVVNPSQSEVSRGGAMKLIIPDSQNVGVVYNADGGYSVNHKKMKEMASGHSTSIIPSRDSESRRLHLLFGYFSFIILDTWLPHHSSFSMTVGILHV